MGEPPAYKIKGLKSRAHLGVPTVAGNRLYTANRAYGMVTAVDIDDPLNPILIEQIQTPGNPCRVAVRNECLIIPNGYSGLLIVEPGKEPER